MPNGAGRHAAERGHSSDKALLRTARLSSGLAGEEARPGPGARTRQEDPRQRPLQATSA